MKSFSKPQMVLPQVKNADLPEYGRLFSPSAGEDYTAVNKRLVFAFGFETRQCVDVPILVDECLEETESFNISLSSEQEYVKFGVNEIQVYLLEDDGN